MSVLSHLPRFLSPVAMVGDVNLFLNDEENPHTAEIEIMIAGKNRLCSIIMIWRRIRHLRKWKVLQTLESINF